MSTEVARCKLNVDHSEFLDFAETFKIDWERIDTGFLLYCNDGIVRVDINDTVTLRVNGDIKIQRGN